MLKTEWKKWDAFVCVLVVLAALGLALLLSLSARGEEAVVEVSLEGGLLAQLPLNGTDKRLEVGGTYPLTVVIADGEVWVEDASCPGGDCQRQGHISRPGQSIACLPDRVSVAIRGQSTVDVIVG